MKQYIYSYEPVYCNLSGWGGLNGKAWETDGYRDIIERKTAEGWRYVGYIPVSQRGTGHIEKMDLIFEKEAE